MQLTVVLFHHPVFSAEGSELAFSEGALGEELRHLHVHGAKAIVRDFSKLYQCVIISICYRMHIINKDHMHAVV